MCTGADGEGIEGLGERISSDEGADYPLISVPDDTLSTRTFIGKSGHGRGFLEGEERVAAGVAI